MDKTKGKYGPQHSLSFRIVAFFSRLQIGYLIHQLENPHILLVLFALTAGSTAMGIITAAAYITHLPLIFPPLAPSAFILFYTPMSPSASPRSVFLSHSIAIVAGIISLKLVSSLAPEANLFDPSVINAQRIMVITLATVTTTLAMVMLKCTHAPATASALIAAMGYMTNPFQIVGLLAAVALLILEAIIFIRILGGLPYPIWKPDNRVAKGFTLLAGTTDEHSTYWQQVTAKLYKRR